MISKEVKSTARMAFKGKILEWLRYMMAPLIFFDGLSRCTKIARSGIIPNEKRRRMLEDKYPDLGKRLFSNRGVLHYLYHGYFRSKCLSYDSIADRIVYCGGSGNNEKEFLFFGNMIKDIYPEAEYEKTKNIYFTERHLTTKGRRLKCFRLVSLLIMVLFFLRHKGSPVLVDAAIKYAKNYESILLSIIKKKAFPSLAVVSNDHTDLNVAFSAVMKTFSVPRVYLQHAEVSTLFPRLDFDYSVLRNQRSVDVYKKIGRLSGKVYVLPRKGVSGSFYNLLEDECEPVAVTIYLSSVFDSDAVKAAVKKLKNNRLVRTVMVKHHPRTRHADAVAFGCDGVAEHIPDYSHIALVPNSSVAIELLGQGVKVFQLFNLDDLGRDYYGFVKDGVTKEIVADDLCAKFWHPNFFTAGWLETFSYYNSSVIDCCEKDKDELLHDLKSELF